MTVHRVFLKMVVLVGLFMAVMLWSSTSDASEARCDALGANCVCANSLTAASWASDGAPYYVGALGTDDKPCVLSGGKHQIIASGAAPTVVTGLGGLNAMRDNATGGVTAQEIGSLVDGLSGRIAARYYIKWNTGYQTTGEGTCTNDKYIQLGDYFTSADTGSTPPNKFTTSNGGAFSPDVSVPDYIGKWVRIEFHINSFTSASSMTVYLKNITDNTPEISFTTGTGANSAYPGIASWINPLHRYRAGGCNGTADLQFLLFAHWASPTGSERIGAASELEGGSSHVTFSGGRFSGAVRIQ